MQAQSNTPTRTKCIIHGASVYIDAPKDEEPLIVIGGEEGGIVMSVDDFPTWVSSLREVVTLLGERTLAEIAADLAC